MRHRVEVILVTDKGYLGELLLNPRWPENVGKIRLPGGKVEGSETPHQAAVRELMEEYQILLEEKDLSLYTVIDNDNGRATRLLYRGSADQFAGLTVTEQGQENLGKLVHTDTLPVPWFSTRKL